MNRNEIVNYWLDSSEVDFRAMDNLFRNRHFTWSLFVGHLVLEKLLKAAYVKNISLEVPRSHNLLQLALKVGMELSVEQQDLLDEVTTFNIKARYPDYKNRFYEKATFEFTEGYILKIKEFREWVRAQLSS